MENTYCHQKMIVNRASSIDSLFVFSPPNIMKGVDDGYDRSLIEDYQPIPGWIF